MAFLKNINTNATDAELVITYKQTGDLKVLGNLYQRYMDLVYGVCLKYLKDSEAAKDSTLAIFEELVGKLQKHDVANFKSWLHQLAKNHCLMLLRSHKKFYKANIDVEFVQKEEFVHLDGGLDKEESMTHLQYCIEQLSSEQKKVVELFYLQEKSYKEITEQEGMEVNTVRSYLQNGRRNLKNCMEKQKQKSALM